MWAVLGVEKEITMEDGVSEKDFPLSFADGMVGALPVFETKKQAEKYANGKFVFQLSDVLKIH